jgi:hypothetical protein
VGARKSRTNEDRKRIVIVSLFFLGIDGVIGGGQIVQGLAMSDVTGWVGPTRLPRRARDGGSSWRNLGNRDQ